MPLITFITASGEQHEVNAEIGYPVAEAAEGADIAGIVMECGGGCACAGCHLLVDKANWESLPKADEMERDMLDFMEDAQPNSRLSCQLIVDESFAGMTFTVPQ